MSLLLFTNHSVWEGKVIIPSYSHSRINNSDLRSLDVALYYTEWVEKQGVRRRDAQYAVTLPQFRGNYSLQCRREKARAGFIHVLLLINHRNEYIRTLLFLRFIYHIFRASLGVGSVEFDYNIYSLQS